MSHYIERLSSFYIRLFHYAQRARLAMLGLLLFVSSQLSLQCLLRLVSSPAAKLIKLDLAA
jgi:hypothetical protein